MRKSYLWAFIICIAIGGWLASGRVIIGGQGETTPSGIADAGTENAPADGALSVGADTPAATGEAKPFRVRVATITAGDRRAELKVRGRTEAAQRVVLRAQTPGLVEEIAVKKGDTVEAGDLICRLEAGSRTSNILKAEAGLAQAELDHEATSSLSEKGFAAETRVRSTKAALHAAQAVLDEARLDMDRTALEAPFHGIVDTLPAKIGTLLNVGDVCAEIIDSDPMLVVAQVSERDVGRIETGMTGSAELVTGDVAEGQIRFIAPSAEESTRTFRIELSVPNPDGKLRDGVTSEITIPLETTQAHRFSPAILALDDNGEIGVRLVDANNRVVFSPVKILGTENGGVWVAGLPETVTVITVGQDFVKTGEIVEPVFETAAGAAASGTVTQ